MCALVVGGSRGLGEVTAKALAAGGADVTITYAVGEAEARGVQSETRAAGAEMDVLRYDVREEAEWQLAGVQRPFTHVFYFATGPMFRPKGTLVHAPYLDEFIAFYVKGFHDLCVALMREGTAYRSKRLVAFYPSSTVVDDRPAGMTELAMAKAAGEQMCRDMAAHMPGLSIVTARLPRMRTDQTATVLPERGIDALRVLLRLLREAAMK
jgi:NAD(P)-dependent dehydrogenase (short-subunit alcohol dehydrogenase family)